MDARLKAADAMIKAVETGIFPASITESKKLAKEAKFYRDVLALITAIQTGEKEGEPFALQTISSQSVNITEP